MQDLKNFIRSGNMVTKLIIVNLAATVVLFVINIIFSGGGMIQDVTKYFLVSDNYIWDITHPWVFFTHIFISNNIMDLIWNLLILYWFGTIIGDMIGDDKVLPVYVMGGIFGAIVYILFLNITGISANSFITGCNTAVLAVTVASAVLVPNYNIRLLLFGNVTLKIVVVIYVLLQLVYAYTSYNDVFYSLTGGVIFGWLYIYSISKSWRLDMKFNNVFEKLKRLISFSIKQKQSKNLFVKSKSKRISLSNKSGRKAEKDKKLDDILKKIKESGYESLTKAEREFLFLASKD